MDSDSAVHRLLAESPASAVAKLPHDPVYLQPGTSMTAALSCFGRSGLSAVPVLAKNEDGELIYNGFVHLSDIVSALCRLLRETDGGAALGSDSLCAKCDELTVGEIQARDENGSTWTSSRHSYVRGDNSISALTALDAMLNGGHTHRIAIVDDDDRLVNVLSDSALLRFLYHKREELGISHSVYDTPLGSVATDSALGTQIGAAVERHSVLTVKGSDLMYNVIQLMDEAGTSAAAITDASGGVLTNVSRSDVLRLILSGTRPPSQTFGRTQQRGKSAGPRRPSFTDSVAPAVIPPKFRVLTMCALEFIGLIRRYTLEARVPAMELPADATIFQALTKLAVTQTHQIYIVAPGHGRTPLFVVGSMDIVRAISNAARNVSKAQPMVGGAPVTDVPTSATLASAA